MMQASNSSQAVREYLTAFYGGDFDKAGTLLADDFQFDGPFVSVAGREAFLNSASGMKGLAQSHQLLRQWQDGEDVCSVYDVLLNGPRKSGSVTMAEWHKVRDDGKLASGRVLFDSVAFRAIVAPDAEG